MGEQITHRPHHVFLHCAHGEAESKFDLTVGQPFQSAKDKHIPRSLGQFHQNHGRSPQRLSARVDAVRPQLDAPVKVWVKRQMLVGVSGLASPKPVRKHAGGGCKHIAVKIFHAGQAAPFNDAQENVLDKIIYFSRVRHVPGEISRQSATKALRAARKICRRTPIGAVPVCGVRVHVLTGLTHRPEGRHAD